MTRPSSEATTQKALVLMAHPAESSLTRAVTSAIVDALQARGHDAEMVDLAAERFNPVFGAADHAAFLGKASLPDDVREEQRRIDRADHLILVYPVYWWAMPALLKGWIDRVFVAGWAFDEDAEGRITKRLGRLKVSLVAIAAASEATYVRRGYREAMKVQIEDGIFDFCGAAVVASMLVTPDRLAVPSAEREIASTLIGPAG
ncbi:NAD(P)H-dependent oxidoreductase [Sphingomonas sp. H39-1-10]|uniref:NAD(P)H-dependent oxidoreductase n=1 Tax=Sphingomonas pollutisoli TaxID=3030829 RepID=UPI0023B8E406|nr:NAD(P)H-dependent oxidoreductase [Sphingomonas pollutisoli]MDF0489511.1 NAD(P)H-dependent oxidoreductase [Sphingomonas pollutisoli]